MEPRNQFTFYRSFFDAISDLPKTQQSATILAVCSYALYGEEPIELPRASMACFKLMKPVIDSGRAKAENGAKGGKANGKQTGNNPEANSKQPESKPEANGKQSRSKKEVEKEIKIKKEIEVEVERKGEINPEAFETIATAAARKLKIMHGELGKGVIILTDEQTDDLLDKLGLEVFDYYVDKLSSYILKNDAKPANHYETILKWWREDSCVEG